MKRRRTEKTVRRSFIYMEKASKIAVKQRKQRKKAPKNRCFFWQGQKDLNPRHAVLEWSRSIKPSPSKPTVLGHLSKHQ